MLRLYSKITFTSKSDNKQIVFDFVNHVEVNQAYEDLTQTAIITIPRKLNFDGKPIATGSTAIFKRGDSVKIELGYFPNLKTVFVGYISKVHPKTPITIECEDAMFLLKNKLILKYSKESVSLKDLIKDIIGDSVSYKLLIEIANIGSFKIINSTVASVLDKLRSNYGLYSYFVDGVLNIGLAENAADTNTEEFKFEETIIDESSLEYYRIDDVKIKVKAISMMPNNTKKEIEVGDSDGELKTFHAYNMNETELKQFADIKLNSFKYEGYRGNFQTFGEPYIRPGDNAKLTSKKFPEKNGTYIVKSVLREFGMNGYRQKIELGLKTA